MESGGSSPPVTRPGLGTYRKCWRRALVLRFTGRVARRAGNHSARRSISPWTCSSKSPGTSDIRKWRANCFNCAADSKPIPLTTQRDQGCGDNYPDPSCCLGVTRSLVVVLVLSLLAAFFIFVGDSLKIRRSDCLIFRKGHLNERSCAREHALSIRNVAPIFVSFAFRAAPSRLRIRGGDEMWYLSTKPHMQEVVEGAEVAVNPFDRRF